MVNLIQARELLQLCEENHLTLALAESCTGGALAASLTSIPGASRVFAGSIVSYQDHVKRDVLHVPQDILTMHGAVSEIVVRKMLEGCLEVMSADVGIAVTGFAEPDAGLILVAMGFRGQEAFVNKLQLMGTRTEIISQTVESALSMVKDFIKKQLFESDLY